MDKDHTVKEWLAGRLTEKELEEFKKTEDYHQYIEVLRYARMFKAPDFSPDEDIASLKRNQYLPAMNPRRLWVGRMARLAAVLLAGFIIYYFYPVGTLVEIQTVAAEQTTIGLPDGSLTTINAGSVLSYDKESWEQQREVKLQGEAYFEVVGGSTFNVITTDWTVTVVGTRFNVKQRDGYFEARCFEGVINVTSKALQKQLTAGDIFQAVGGEVSMGSNSYIEPQWTSNVSVFQNTPLSEVFAELERQFGVKVNIETIDETRLFTGGFDQGDLEKALIAITEPLNLKYDLDSQTRVTIRSK